LTRDIRPATSLALCWFQLSPLQYFFLPSHADNLHRGASSEKPENPVTDGLLIERATALVHFLFVFSGAGLDNVESTITTPASGICKSATSMTAPLKNKKGVFWNRAFYKYVTPNGVSTRRTKAQPLGQKRRTLLLERRRLRPPRRPNHLDLHRHRHFLAYIVGSPLASAGVPETREYLLRGMIKDDEIGLDSDVARIAWSGA
jgi:hypothetical protein